MAKYGKIEVTEDCNGIKGLKVIEPSVFGDERGYFMETYNYNDFLSIVFTMEYGIEGWPQTVMRGYAFNSNTGDIIHAKDSYI